jgi:hypothetical protein
MEVSINDSAINTNGETKSVVNFLQRPAFPSSLYKHSKQCHHGTYKDVKEELKLNIYKWKATPRYAHTNHG